MRRLLSRESARSSTGGTVAQGAGSSSRSRSRSVRFADPRFRRREPARGRSLLRGPRAEIVPEGTVRGDVTRPSEEGPLDSPGHDAPYSEDREPDKERVDGVIHGRAPCGPLLPVPHRDSDGDERGEIRPQDPEHRQPHVEVPDGKQPPVEQHDEKTDGRNRHLDPIRPRVWAEEPGTPRLRARRRRPVVRGLTPHIAAAAADTTGWPAGNRSSGTPASTRPRNTTPRTRVAKGGSSRSAPPRSFGAQGRGPGGPPCTGASRRTSRRSGPRSP